MGLAPPAQPRLLIELNELSILNVKMKKVVLLILFLSSILIIETPITNAQTPHSTLTNEELRQQSKVKN